MNPECKGTKKQVQVANWEQELDKPEVREDYFDCDAWRKRVAGRTEEMFLELQCREWLAQIALTDGPVFGE